MGTECTWERQKESTIGSVSGWGRGGKLILRQIFLKKPPAGVNVATWALPGWPTRQTERGLGGHAWVLARHGPTATQQWLMEIPPVLPSGRDTGTSVLVEGDGRYTDEHIYVKERVKSAPWNNDLE